MNNGGDIVSCLRKGQCAPLRFYKSVLFVDVEAYGNDCCAASVSNCTDLDPTTHVHSVTYEDDCLYDFAAIGNALTLQGELLIDETNDNISRHFHFDLDLDPQISKTSKTGGVYDGLDVPAIRADGTLVQGSATNDTWRPGVAWPLCPPKLNHGQTPFQVETHDDSLVPAFVPTQLTPDEAVPVAGCIDWTIAPPVVVTTSSFREAIQEAVINKDVNHLTVIAQSAMESDNLRITTYGHFAGDRGTRSFDIPIVQVHQLFSQVAALWQDWSEPHDLDVFLLTPQLDDHGVDLQLVVGHQRQPGQLLLVDLRGEEPCRVTVKVGHPTTAFDLVANVRGTFDETASYITRRGGVIWQNFVPLPTANGQYWTILQHRSEFHMLQLIQTQTTLLPSQPSTGQWHRKAELPEDYLNLLEESDTPNHPLVPARGPMIFERDDEWVRLLHLTRPRDEQGLQVCIHSLLASMEKTLGRTEVSPHVSAELKSRS